MSRWQLPTAPAIDPVGTAGVLSALAGLASVDWPFFEGMTAALSALALLGWLTQTPSGTFGWRRPIGLATLAASGIAWGFFLFGSGPLGLVRGAVLGGSAGLVGWIGRRRPAFGQGP